MPGVILNCVSPSGGVCCCIGPEIPATCSHIDRVLESRLDRFRTSMTLNTGRVSAQLPGDISIGRPILDGVHVKYIS